MGILSFTQPEPTPEPKHPKTRTQTPKSRPKHRKPDPNPTKKVVKQPSSWDNFKNLLTCKQVGPSLVHDPSKKGPIGSGIGYPKLSSSCGSMCSFRGVAHGNTRRVVHRSDSSSPESSSLGQESRLLARRAKHGSSSGSGSNRSLSSSVSAGASASSVYSVASRGMPLRKLSGCYECHMIVDPSRYPIIPRSTVCACSECGEIFPKVESLEHHQAVRHAVAELGGEDSGRNIVEIIFKSSWQKKEDPICKIERILKVKNTSTRIQRFEDCRDVVKLRGNNNNTKKNPRCAADGNELLRFHSTNLLCSLGSNGSTSLCSISHCGVCTIIRHGFQGSQGVRTMASSGKAHDCLDSSTNVRRAMLVCRVIAGRVRRSSPNGAPIDEETPAHDTMVAPYDSVAGSHGIYSSLEDLVVFNPRAILPCFVVIYNTMPTT